MSGDFQDPRFSAMHSSSLFKKSSKNKHKVKVDQRFKAVLEDDRFKTVAGGVDKYGRKNKKSTSKELEEFYEIEEEETEKIPQESKQTSESKPAKEPKEDRLDYLTRLARGEISGESSSDDDSDLEDSSEDSDADSEEAENDKGETSKGALSVPGDEIEESEEIESTSRLALQNCDWSHVTSKDILFLLQSFCPPGGSVRRVRIFPSDFGIKRMALESQHGPQWIWNNPDDEDGWEEEGGEGEGLDFGEEMEGNEEDEDEEESGEEGEGEEEGKETDDKGDGMGKGKGKGDFQRRAGHVGLVLSSQGLDPLDEQEGDIEGDHHHPHQSSSEQDDSVAIRRYELSKMRYFFCIVDLDSPSTASALYSSLDGVELEHSAMVLDLRIVPDDVDFSGREVRDQCVSSQISSDFEPSEFVSKAMQHTKVECSWEGDEDGQSLGGAISKAMNRGRGKGQGGRNKGGAGGAGSLLSQWRRLKEGDIHEYLASGTESEGEEEEAGEEEEKTEKTDPKKKKNKANKKLEEARRLRRLLLGEDAGDLPSEDEDEDRVPKSQSKPKNKSKSSGFEDEFFLGQEGGEEGGDEGGDEGGMSMTFVPEEDGKEMLERRKGGKQASPGAAAEETVLEAQLRKISEQKKMKKQKEKERKEERERQELEEKLHMKEERKKQAAKRKEMKRLQHLEDIGKLPRGEAKRRVEEQFGGRDDQNEEGGESFDVGVEGGEGDSSGEEEGTFDMRDIVRQDKVQRKKKDRSKRKRGQDLEEGSQSASSEGFSVNVTDSRFERLFKGDHNFGIDKLAPEFKETPGMRAVLKKQSENRSKNLRSDPSQTTSDISPPSPLDDHLAPSSSSNSSQDLVKKLKQRLGKNTK